MKELRDYTLVECMDKGFVHKEYFQNIIKGLIQRPYQEHYHSFIFNDKVMLLDDLGLFRARDWLDNFYHSYTKMRDEVKQYRR